MGISKLLPFLKEHNCFEVFQGFPEGHRIAVDVPIFAHKFIYAEKTYKSLERRFLSFANDLRETHKVEPIFVFDGLKIDLKDDERQRRAVHRSRQMDLSAIKRSRELEDLMKHTDTIISYGHVGAAGAEGAEMSDASLPSFNGIMFPTQREYETLKKTLLEAGYEAIGAKYEAEALCAHLTTTGRAWCALTEDTDAVAFGSTRTLFKFFSETPVLINLSTVYANLSLNQEQFVELCCMFGCDFCSNVYKIGPNTAFKLLGKHKSWASIYAMTRFGMPLKTRESADLFETKLMRVKSFFMSQGAEALEINASEALDAIEALEASEALEINASEVIAVDATFIDQP